MEFCNSLSYFFWEASQGTMRNDDEILQGLPLPTPSLGFLTEREFGEFKTMASHYSSIWLTIRIIVLVTVLTAAVFLSWWYNSDVDESVKTNTRYTWLTWLETLDRVSGLALGIFVTLLVRKMTSVVTQWAKSGTVLKKN
jgi:hypothetical protein